MSESPAYWVYIITGHSHSRVLYTGVTSALAARIAQHRAGTIPGFASTYKCHILVFFESFDDVNLDVNLAIAREKQLLRLEMTRASMAHHTRVLRR